MLNKLIQDIDRKEYLVFDFDLTLVRMEIDWTKWHVGVTNIYSQFDINHGYQKGKNPHEFYNQMAGKFGEGLISAIREFNENFEEMNVTGFTPYRELVNLVKRLDNKRLFIYSSNSRKTVQKGLQEFDLLEYFYQIISRDDLIFLKPNPEGFNLISDFSINRNKFLMIGDSNADEGAARKAEVDFVKIDYFDTYKFK